MSAFNTVVQPKANKGAIKQNNNKKRKWDRSAERAPKQSKKMAKDDENYIGYVSRDHHAEADRRPLGVVHLHDLWRSAEGARRASHRPTLDLPQVRQQDFRQKYRATGYDLRSRGLPRRPQLVRTWRGGVYQTPGSLGRHPHRHSQLRRDASPASRILRSQE